MASINSTYLLHQCVDGLVACASEKDLAAFYDLAHHNVENGGAFPCYMLV